MTGTASVKSAVLESAEKAFPVGTLPRSLCLNMAAEWECGASCDCCRHADFPLLCSPAPRRWNAIRRSHAPSRTPSTTYVRSEEHTSELQSLMRISYAVFCLKKKIQTNQTLAFTTNTMPYK